MRQSKEPKPTILAGPSEAYKTFPSKDQISLKDFSKIINVFTVNMLNEILTTGVSFKIPYGIGIIGIKKEKIARRVIDWTNSLKERKITYVQRSYMGDVVPKFCWLKTRKYGGIFTFNDIWRLKFCRMAKRASIVEALENNNIIKYF